MVSVAVASALSAGSPAVALEASAASSSPAVAVVSCVQAVMDSTERGGEPVNLAPQRYLTNTAECTSGGSTSQHRYSAYGSSVEVAVDAQVNQQRPAAERRRIGPTTSSRVERVQTLAKTPMRAAANEIAVAVYSNPKETAKARQRQCILEQYESWATVKIQEKDDWFLELQHGDTKYPVHEVVAYSFLHAMFQAANGGLSRTDCMSIRNALNHASVAAGGEKPFTMASDAKHAAELRTMQRLYGIGNKKEDVDALDADTFGQIEGFVDVLYSHAFDDCTGLAVLNRPRGLSSTPSADDLRMFEFKRFCEIELAFLDFMASGVLNVDTAKRHEMPVFYEHGLVTWFIIHYGLHNNGRVETVLGTKTGHCKFKALTDQNEVAAIFGAKIDKNLFAALSFVNFDVKTGHWFPEARAWLHTVQHEGVRSVPWHLKGTIYYTERKIPLQHSGQHKGALPIRAEPLSSISRSLAFVNLAYQVLYGRAYTRDVFGRLWSGEQRLEFTLPTGSSLLCSPYSPSWVGTRRADQITPEVIRNAKRRSGYKCAMGAGVLLHYIQEACYAAGHLKGNFQLRSFRKQLARTGINEDYLAGGNGEAGLQTNARLADWHIQNTVHSSAATAYTGDELSEVGHGHVLQFYQSEGRRFKAGDPTEHAGRELHPNQCKLQSQREAPIGALRARLLVADWFAQKHDIAVADMIAERIDDMEEFEAGRVRADGLPGIADAPEVDAIRLQSIGQPAVVVSGTVSLSQELSRLNNMSVSDLRDEAQRLLVDCSVPESTAVEAKADLMNRKVLRFVCLFS